MLQVHSSNHLESLLDRLLTRINQGDPFCAEVIVVENPGMSRWLQQQIAAYDGISANLRFVSPAQFIWDGRYTSCCRIFYRGRFFQSYKVICTMIIQGLDVSSWPAALQVPMSGI